MLEIVQSSTFGKWLADLKDRRGRAIILTRIDRLATGNRGDWEPVGNGIFELRIHYGPGYRIYVLERGRTIAVLLCGGDKSSQKRDIATAKAIARQWKD
jgi:putative addiction module killer protein